MLTIWLTWIGLGLVVMFIGCVGLNLAVDMFDSVWGLFLGLISCCVLGLGICLPFAPIFIIEEQNCEARGGEIVGTGVYEDVTTFVSSGNTMIPVTSEVEITACTK